MAELPEPARRWLAHAVAAGTPRPRFVELGMRGEIRIGAWRPFVARQVVRPGAGFIWAATARICGVPISGSDRYWHGSGEMRWRLAGLLPVMSGSGPDITRSAAGRFAGECTAFVPTACIDAEWAAAGPDTAAVTWSIDGQRESVVIRVGAAGNLEQVTMARWGNPDGRPYDRYPFGVTVEAERTVAGITIPDRLRAGWWSGTDRERAGEFFRARIESAEFR